MTTRFFFAIVHARSLDISLPCILTPTLWLFKEVFVQKLCSGLVEFVMPDNLNIENRSKSRVTTFKEKKMSFLITIAVIHAKSLIRDCSEKSETDFKF